MSDKGVEFVGNGASDVSGGNYNTQPSVSKSGKGPIDFVGDGNLDCSGTIDTNNKNSSAPGGSGTIEFVA